jgi:sugar/nucleoside kinase (ribokinase family)
MSGTRPGPVVCFSYLAAAELWSVPRFPHANYGAEVFAIEQSIAADGPMVAAVLTALGVPSLLLANDVGDDACGSNVREWLRSHHVETAANVESNVATPQIVVVADNAHTRTWFSYLPGVVDALPRVDLSPFAEASFAYIDCYQLIEAPAVRAIRAARSASVPLLLNLGGSPLTTRIADAVRGYPGVIVQTNVGDDQLAEAQRIAPFILEDTGAEWAVITAGTSGVLALSRSEHLVVPAFRAEVHHTHCAGAAFSGGLIYGLLQNWPMRDSLSLACASGTLRCERAHQVPMPTLGQLRALMSSREFHPVSAA